MREYRRFYIDGAWIGPAAARSFEVVNPATEAVVAVISLGDRTDVDRAVAAARRAFDGWSRTSREERIAVLGRIVDACKHRMDDLAQAITEEMGAPLATVSRPMQAPSAVGHFKVAMDVLAAFEFERAQGATRIVREPIGVIGMITPWNWPANQIACKVAPALAAGCTMVLKPSEMAPLSALVIAEILHEAGVPKGVFNLVNGDGPTVGAALAGHPGIDMISFTGSTRAGILVDKAAADTVKKVALELGGKSPNILLDDADFRKAVGHGVATMMLNTGQSCNAPSRMLVPSLRTPEVEQVALSALAKVKVGDPLDPATTMGPQASGAQWRRVQGTDRDGDQGGRARDRRWPGAPGRAGPRVLYATDDLQRRDEQHDRRARGDLRSRALHTSLHRRRRGNPHRERHAVRIVGLRVVGRSGARARGGASHPRRQRPPQRRRGSTPPRRSAATSNPALAASGAHSGWRSFSRSRPSWATAEAARMADYRSPWMDDDLELFRDTARRFVETEMVPHDARWREQHHVDREMWRKAGEAGLLFTDMPAEYGGGGGDFRHEAIVVRGARPPRHRRASDRAVHSIVAHYVLNHGTEEQKQRWLPRMASGELVGAIA